MKQHRSGTVLESVVRGVLDRLLRRVAWHASERRNLSRQPGDFFPLVTILGREHYSERSKTYPALGRHDLEKVLREELVGEPPTLTLLGPINGDKREVSFFRLDLAVIEALPRSIFILPESVLLKAQLLTQSWAEVERQGYRYFLFRGGPSQPAGGALRARELVAMAAGVDPAQVPEEWRGADEVLQRLRRSLSKLPISSWWSCRNPLPRRLGLDAVAWKPLAMTAGLVLFVYLALSSIYLQALLGHRNGILDTLGPEIQEGLVADNETRVLAARRDALLGLWAGRADTQLIWQGVALALQNRASVQQFELRSGRVSLRGEAEDASEVLAVLSRQSGFADASFDAPVRTARNGRQNFAISFALSAVRAEPVASNE